MKLIFQVQINCELADTDLCRDNETNIQKLKLVL